METENTQRPSPVKEYRIWLPCALLSLFLASYLSYGWPLALTPFNVMSGVYAGDGLFHAWLSQRVLESTLFENVRNGYPFGSTFLDFPASDAGSYAVIELSKFFSDDGFTADTVYFLIGFPLCFVASYLVLRMFSINAILSVTAAFVYTFASFHFSRRAHMFYTFYFVVPIYFYLASLAFWRPLEFARRNALKLLLVVLAAGIVASFGVYYAFFGIVIIGFSGVAGWLRARRFSHFGFSLLVCAGIALSVGLNLAPYINYERGHGENAEMAHRSASESELLGLKLIQLLLPRRDHRIASMGQVAIDYSATSPLSNENMTASMGVLGSLGLMTCFVGLLLATLGRRVDARITFFALTALVLFMTGTIGGLGAIFAWVVSPSIRAWNRISIFIQFAALGALFMLIQNLAASLLPRRMMTSALAVICALLLLFAWIDQTTPPCLPCIAKTQDNYRIDKDFYGALEASLPPSSAVYELPYVWTPESPPVNGMLQYEHLRPFLDTKTLRWSLGGTRGRIGDLFYRSLSDESPDEQLGVIRKLGFAGVLVNRRGYADNGDAVIAAIQKDLGAPSATNARGDEVFFKLQGEPGPDLSGRSPAEIMRVAGYEVNRKGQYVAANLFKPLNFSKQALPSFIVGVEGLSGVERWGRWSDAALKPQVMLSFDRDLPDQFDLTLRARAFGPNVGKDAKVVIGSRSFTVRPGATPTDMRISVNLQGEAARTIVIVPPIPTSPASIAISTDKRQLGIGLLSLRLSPPAI